MSVRTIAVVHSLSQAAVRAILAEPEEIPESAGGLDAAGQVGAEADQAPPLRPRARRPVIAGVARDTPWTVRELELLIDLVENRLADMMVLDREDVRDRNALDTSLGKLKDLRDGVPRGVTSYARDAVATRASAHDSEPTP